MKTKTTPHPITPRSFTRLIAISCILAIVSLFSTQTASAAAPNGTYRLTSAYGSIKVGTMTIKLTRKDTAELLGDAGLDNARVLVRNNTIKINRAALIGDLVRQAKELGIPVTTKVTGPTSIKFRKSGRVYKAKTTKPVVAKFTAKVKTPQISGNLGGNMKMTATATVSGRKIKAVVPITGAIMGVKIKARFTLEGIR